MASNVTLKYTKETNIHVAALPIEHTSFSFKIDITKCEDMDEVKTLIVHILQKGNMDPILDYPFSELCVVGGSKLMTRQFSVPLNPDYQLPFMMVIKSNDPDVTLDKFEFQVACTSILA